MSDWIKLLLGNNDVGMELWKYTRQEQVMVRETPELYERVVKPYIMGFPASRTLW